MGYADPGDYLIGAGGSLFVHAFVVYLALLFGNSSPDLELIPEQTIIRAELVSAEQLEARQQSSQRVIDLTRQPPTAAPLPADRIQVPVEPQPVQQPPAQEPAEPPPQSESDQNQDEEAERLAEQQRRAEQEQQEISRRQDDLDSQLQAELNALAEIENQQVVASYAAWIAERVENNWSRPPSARSGMVVQLRVNLLPAGRVAATEVIESSGDSAFDRSAVLAVSRAEPYSRLAELDSSIFDEHFRQFVFVFNPQDLRL